MSSHFNISKLHNISFFNFLKFYIQYYIIFFILGIDGFYWFLFLPFLIYLFLKDLSGKTIIYFYALSLLITASISSFFYIDEVSRYFTWFRDIYIFIFMCLLIYFIRIYDFEKTITSLLKPIILIISAASLLSLILVLLNTNLTFKTPFFYILPEFLINTDFGKNLVHKEFVQKTWFFNQEFPRIKSIFTYSTSFGVGLSIVLTLLLTHGKRIFNKKLIFYTIFFILFLTLLLTTARLSIFAFLVGAILYLLVYKNVFIKIATSIILFSSFLLIINLNIFDKISNLRGGGSKETRGSIYESTISHIKTNPIGHGSYVDVPELPLPLGSHSTWLAIPFKYGIVGFLGFFLFSSLIIFHNFKYFGIIRKSYLVLFPVIILLGTLEEFFLDSLTAIILSVVIGTVTNQSSTYKS